MLKCPKCGAQMPDSMNFCTECGAPLMRLAAEAKPVQDDASRQEPVQTPPQYDFDQHQTPPQYDFSQHQTPPQNPVYTATVSSQQGGSVNGGMMAWSIINTVFGFLMCCSCLPFISFVLGIIAIVMTSGAAKKPNDAAQQDLNTVKVLNIIATALIVLGIILSVLAQVGSRNFIPSYTNELDDLFNQYY